MLDRTVHLALGAVTVLALGILGATQREVPRCPVGLVPLGARCCGEGQTLAADGSGRCIGTPSRCSDRLLRTDEGCVAARRRATIPGGSSSWHPPDTTIAPVGETAVTKTFQLDAYEVTWSAWRRCAETGACASLAAIGDPGQAVHSVTRDEARAFCRHAGGRLPRDGEWLRAAIGDVETRYPWGDPDAFCLRAAFALDGRCAHGAKVPDTAGARPWGATKEGVEDLAGNVAEWVEEGSPIGMAAVRGGSWAEPDATSLRPRWRRVLDPASRHAWVGLRCAYDL